MKPRLLFVSQCLPYPPHSGVANRTFHILSELQREFDVHLLSYSRRNHQPDPKARQAAKSALGEALGRVYEPVPIASERGRLAQLWCHLQSLAARRPYTYYEYSSRALERELRSALGGPAPALVHLDSLDLYRWVPYLPRRPVAVTHHSIESDLLRSRARHYRPRWLRGYLRLQAGWLEEVERRHCSEIALNVMMSDPDARRLEALAPDARTVVIPNGVDVDYFRPTGTALRAGPVLFLGPTYMYPNRDAVEYFLAEIWPRVRQAVPNASLELVGKTPDALKPSFLAHPRVTCQGYVPDVRPHLAAAACSVVPIRIGGGTRLKILDSWAMGKAVVSTSVGCEGLRAVDGENIMIRDDAGGFADAVVRVLEDAALRDRLGAAGRRTAEKWYSWGTIGDQLIAAYRGLGI